MATVIEHFGSAWVEITIEAPDDSDHLLMTRRPGPLGPSHFPVVWRGDPVIANGVELVWPDIKDEALTYRISGPAAAVRWLRCPDIAFHRRAIDAVGRCTDVVMDVCGDVASTHLLTALPAPLRRLSTHLENAPTTPSVLRWRAALEDAVDRPAVAGLLDLLASHHTDDPTFAHGGLSLGGIIPLITGAYDCVLTGEDSGSASAGHDIGWLVGELIELRAAAGAAKDESSVGLMDEAIGDILRKHGQHSEGIRRAAILRIALHAEDYAHHMGWSDVLIMRAHLVEQVWTDETWASMGRPPGC